VVDTKGFEYFEAISMDSESFENTEADLKGGFEDFGANSEGILEEFKDTEAEDLKELQYFVVDTKGFEYFETISIDSESFKVTEADSKGLEDFKAISKGIEVFEAIKGSKETEETKEEALLINIILAGVVIM
jgi:hypothetical protein